MAFAVAVFRVDTTVDGGPGDAYRRAAAYMDASLTAEVVAERSLPVTVEWQEWVAHRAYVDVDVEPYAGDALPPAGGDKRYEAVLVASRPVGRDGWRGPEQQYTVECVLRSAGGGWRVSGYEIG